MSHIFQICSFIYVTDFFTDGANQYIRTSKQHKVTHSMKFQHSEYQQILQTTVTDNNKVHILYPAPIFLLQNNVSSP